MRLVLRQRDGQLGDDLFQSVERFRTRSAAVCVHLVFVDDGEAVAEFEGFERRFAVLGGGREVDIVSRVVQVGALSDFAVHALHLAMSIADVHCAVLPIAKVTLEIPVGSLCVGGRKRDRGEDPRGVEIEGRSRFGE